MRIDFHTHTTASPDSPISPESLAKKARELGIVPSLTDHYSMGSVGKFRELGVPFIPGEELRVREGKKSADLIGLFMNEPVKKGAEIGEAFDLLRSQGALIYAPHPFDSFRMGLGDSPFLKKADIIEVFNPHSPSSANGKSEDFAKGEGIPGATGSDCHFLYEFGKTYTEIELDELEPRVLLKSLKKGAKLSRVKSSRARRLLHRAASSLLKPFV